MKIKCADMFVERCWRNMIMWKYVRNGYRVLFWMLSVWGNTWHI